MTYYERTIEVSGIKMNVEFLVDDGGNFSIQDARVDGADDGVDYDNLMVRSLKNSANGLVKEVVMVTLKSLIQKELDAMADDIWEEAGYKPVSDYEEHNTMYAAF